MSSITPIYVEETCPLEGYEELSVHVLANSTVRQFEGWRSGHLGGTDCPQCAKLSAPKVVRGRRAKAPAANPQASSSTVYCPACTAARAAFGQAVVAFYGPTLLGHDVSTPDAALALFDSDDLLPSEIVIWLQLVPGAVRNRRQETLLGNLISS
jgi:hypothetical protein